MKKIFIFIILIFISTTVLCEYSEAYWRKKYNRAASGWAIAAMEYYEVKGLVKYSKKDFGKFLHKSIIYQLDKSAMYFVEKDININQTSIYLNSYLISSIVYSGSHEMCKRLIEKGIDVNKKNIFGNTALDYAIKIQKSFEFYKLFIENGARVTKKQIKLELRNEEYRPDKLLYLYNHLQNKSNSGLSRLMEALLLKNDKYIDEFIRKHKKIKPQKYTGEFFIALRNGNIEFVQYFIENGYDVNQIYYPDTPLMAAAEYGQLDIVKYLISKGADVYVKNHNFESAIHRAIQGGQSGVIEFLFDKKYYNDINDVEISESGKTFSIAYEAALNENIEFLEYLFKKGLHLNSKNKINIFRASFRNDNYKISKYIIDKSNNINVMHNDSSFLTLAILFGNFELVKYLIKKGANVNLKDSLGGTPLQKAVTYYENDIAWYLIKHGANINAYSFRDYKQKKKSENILMIASFHHNIDLVKYMIKHRVDVNYTNYDGNTALHYACREGYLEIVKLLVNNGANINQRSKEWQTPLMEAQNYHNQHVVDFLIENGADTFEIK